MRKKQKRKKSGNYADPKDSALLDHPCYSIPQPLCHSATLLLCYSASFAIRVLTVMIVLVTVAPS